MKISALGNYESIRTRAVAPPTRNKRSGGGTSITVLPGKNPTWTTVSFIVNQKKLKKNDKYCQQYSQPLFWGINIANTYVYPPTEWLGPMNWPHQGVLSFLRRSRRCFPLGSHQVFSGPTKRTFTEDVVYIRHSTSTYLSISITPLASFFCRNWFLIFLLQTSPPAGTDHYSASRTVLLNSPKMLNVEFTIIYHGRDPLLVQSPCFLWFKRWLMLKMVKAGGSITIPRRIEGRFRRIVPHGPAPLHWHHPHLTWSLGAGMLKSLGIEGNLEVKLPTYMTYGQQQSVARAVRKEKESEETRSRCPKR